MRTSPPPVQCEPLPRPRNVQPQSTQPQVPVGFRPTMPLGNKRYQHLKRARALSVSKCKKTETQDIIDKEAVSELQEVVPWEPEVIPAAVHWAGVEDGDQEEDDCAISEAEEDEEQDQDTFAMMMRCAEKGSDEAFESVKFPHQRGPKFSKKQQRRKNIAAQQLEEAAMDCRPLDKGWLINSKYTEAQSEPESEPELDLEPKLECGISREQMELEERNSAIEKLERKLRSAKTDLFGQNLTRHRAVLSFLKIQQGKQLESREGLSYMVARCFGRGLYFAHKVVEWERQWIKTGKIEEGRQGCFQKIASWFDDEGVLLAVRKWLAGAGEDITAYKLAKVVGDYLDSRKAGEAVEACLNAAEAASDDNFEQELLPEATVTPTSHSTIFGTPLRVMATLP
ncbi:hypothetical protein FN846DRAFT_919514 [Sphaerosporella brunnea]|uniref:Uncharacterized protein n=1 Tax=Sphaerosporella brunnea TaxID=1250544 RepID=A0A5J5EWS3_9PEZI|nr:hypothetical protein FN846DRAFT_919514 [Sphaerosporella brunnea]